MRSPSSATRKTTRSRRSPPESSSREVCGADPHGSAPFSLHAIVRPARRSTADPQDLLAARFDEGGAGLALAQLGAPQDRAELLRASQRLEPGVTRHEREGRETAVDRLAEHRHRLSRLSHSRQLTRDVEPRARVAERELRHHLAEDLRGATELAFE